MRKYMSRSKQIIYLCNLTMSVQVIKFLCEMFSDWYVIFTGIYSSHCKLAEGIVLGSCKSWFGNVDELLWRYLVQEILSTFLIISPILQLVEGKLSHTASVPSSD